MLFQKVQFQLSSELLIRLMSKIRGNADSEYDLAVRQGSAKQLRSLIARGVTPRKRLMLFALIRKHPELLPILKDAGADPNDADGFNERALGHAVNEYPLEVVKTLLELGADPNKESLHLLPLVWVAYDDQIEYIRALLDHGANPNLPQWNGVIPLHAAVRNGQYQVVKLFLEAGADPTFKGPDGKDSIELARSIKVTNLVALLESFVDKNARKPNHTRSLRRKR